MTLEYKLLKKAYNDSSLDVSTLVIEDMSDSDYQDFAKAIYINAENDLRSDLMGDFICDGTTSPFLDDEFTAKFAAYIANAYRDEITDFLVKAQDNYEREACEAFGGGAW